MVEKKKDNPLAASLAGGEPRRRAAGERSRVPEEEKLLTVSIPVSLHRELKRAAASGDENMKAIVIRLLRAELGDR